MKNLKHITILVALGLAGLGTQAQQDPMYTMYMWNTMAVNPGYAGSADLMTVTALSRMQWLGLRGAPSTQSLVLHTPLREESLGLGGSINYDEIGPTRNLSVFADFAYRIYTTKKARLAFGLKGGINYFQSRLTEVENTDAADPLFNQDVSGSLRPNFGFGLYYWSRMGYFGIATPKLLQYDYGQADANGDQLYFAKEKRHYFIIGGYVFELDRDIKFRPSILLKGVEGAPVSIDISAMFLFYEKFWAGLAYRHHDSMSAIISYQISDRFRAGYSYDFTLTKLQQHNSGSHELMLNYDFLDRRRRVRSPRYF